MDTALIINLILGILEPAVLTVCLFYFLRSIKRDIYKKKKVYVAAFILYAAGFYLAVLAPGEDAIVLIYELAGAVIIGYFLFQRSGMQIFYTVFYVVSIFSMQGLAIYGLLTWMMGQGVFMDMTGANLTIALKAVMAVLITKIWIVFINRRRIIRISGWGYASLFIPLCISVALLFSITNMAGIYIQLYGAQLVLINIALVIALNGYFIYLLTYLARNGRLQNELEMLKGQSELQYRYYETLERKYRDSRKVIHDMRNHLDSLEQLYQIGDSEAKEYAGDIRKLMESMGQTYYTDSRMLNIILNEKAKEAKDAGIHMEISIGDIELDHMKDIDITTIFANLLDNAIHAAGRDSEGAGIRMKADHYRNFLVISIQNTVGEADCKKAEHHEGLGLLNVKRTLETYQGSMQIEEHEKDYHVIISIPR